MRIAVSGTTGLIGSAVAARLAKGNEIVCIGRHAGADRIVDFSNPNSVEALDLSGVAALIHCAGIVDEDFRADPAVAFRQATLGAEALVRRAVAGGVSRIAYISSAHVYGPMRAMPDESSPVNPLSNYAIAHFASEQILRRSASAFIKAAVFRPNAVFGIPPSLAGFRRWALIPFAFPRAALEHSAIVLKSNGLQWRNFVAAADVAEVVARWLAREDLMGFSPFNPVGAHSMSVLAFAQLCAQVAEELTGRPCAVRHAGGGKSEAFDYRTLHQFCHGTANLRSTIRSLLQALQKEAAMNTVDESTR